MRSFHTMVCQIRSRIAVGLIATTSLAFGTVSSTIADDNHWSNWRGPTADGVAAESATPPTEWSTTKNVRWKKEIPGNGINTPIVWGDRIYLMSALSPAGAATEAPPANRGEGGRGGEGRGGEGRGRGGEGRGGRGGGGGGGGGGAPNTVLTFTVFCLDRNSGEIIWQKAVTESKPHEGVHPTNTYASGSAVTDGKRLYAWFGSFGMHCLDLEGNVLWQKDFGDMRTRNSFGEGGSPALHGNTLVIPWDHEGQSKLFAVNAETGEEKWSVDRDEPTTWSTPLITEFKGKVQVITNGTNRVRSYDLETGKVIWECGGQVTNPIPTPIRFGDSVIVATGYRGFSIMSIKLDSQGDVTDTAQVNWKRSDAAPYVSSPVLYDNRLYFTKSRDAIYSVVNANTGDVILAPSRLEGIDSTYASPIAANGHIYFAGRNGTVVVLSAGDKPNVVAVNNLEETIDASPVALGKQLFIRTVKHLYCIEGQ